MSGWVDCHVTEFVISCVELSENFPIALNCTGVPLLMSGLSGLMVTLRSTGAFPAAGTVTLVQPLAFPLGSVAAMFAMPASFATHEPGEEKSATAGRSLLHSTDAVTFSVKPSSYTAVAVRISMSPLLTSGFAGVTTIPEALRGPLP